MPELIVLGTAASVPDAAHDTIGLLLRGTGWSVLVECGGSSLHKLARLGVDMDTLRAVVLTHRHADHIYGLPMLVQGLWLSGREEPLPVYGPGEALEVARTMLGLFGLDERPDMFTLEWLPVPPREGPPGAGSGRVCGSAQLRGSMANLTHWRCVSTTVRQAGRSSTRATRVPARP